MEFRAKQDGVNGVAPTWVVVEMAGVGCRASGLSPLGMVLAQDPDSGWSLFLVLVTSGATVALLA